MDVPAATSAAYRDTLLLQASTLPPFSPILNRLLANLAKEDVQFSDISELIEKDTVLAGNLLRLVNSALYGLAGTVNSVRHALAIVGLEKMRNMVLTMSFARLWRRNAAVPGWSPVRFNLHSTAAAILADLIAQHVPVEYAEGAFTAGLFHDFGQFLVATVLPREFDSLQSCLIQEYTNAEDCEREIFGITHSELAAAALEGWRLPEAIVRAVRQHHSPEASSGGSFSLSRVVQAANECVNRLGINVLASHPECGKPPLGALEAVGISNQSASLMDEFRSELDLAKSFF
jgi:HD-like signal output (HDOD) protein